VSEHELDTLLVETIARHFPDAHIDGTTVDLAVAGLRIDCHVNGVRPLGVFSSASLFFYLSGGALGERPVFASISGYDETPEHAVVVGACNWACSFGPVLRAALAGEEQPGVARTSADIHGQRFHLFVDGLDRVMSFGEPDPDLARTKAARARLGAAPWLVGVVAASGRLPVLPADRPSVLSVFVGERPDGRIVEVKVHGVDWPAAQAAIAGDSEPAGAMTLLRELAVAVPAWKPGPLARGAVATTLAGLGEPLEHGARTAVDWRGWRAHGGELGPPLVQDELERLERATGPLPDDIRQFFAEVAGRGAGPGYGLLPPSAALAAGSFDWRDGEQPDGPPAGVLPLAHAGCGVVWLLVLRGPHRGEVWVDAGGSDRIARRVAGSFEGWYRAWLDAAVRDAGPWTQWNGHACATPRVLSRVLDQIEGEGVSADDAVAALADRIGEGSICITTAGSPYFQAGAVIDPCHSCAATAARVGVTDGAFQVGAAPLQDA
jgi:hypothetical protein